MPVVEYDVSSNDGTKVGTFQSPTPGVYKCKVVECKLGYKKGRNGKDDKSAPRVEVIYEVVGKKFKSSRLWDYLALTEAAAWKLDQFLQAVGIAQPKAKRKGKFDPAKQVGKLVNVRVKAGENQDGEYRGEVGSVFAVGEEDDDEVDDDDTDDEGVDEDVDDDEEEDDDDSEDDSEDDDEEDDDEEEGEDDDEEEGEEEVLYYSKDELDGMTLGALKDVASDLGLEIPSGKKKAATIATWIFDNQPGEAPEEEEGDDDDAPDYSDWDLKALRKECSDRDLETTGKKPDLIARLEENDQEEPF